jgi:hypothetical protein
MTGKATTRKPTTGKPTSRKPRTKTQAQTQAPVRFPNDLLFVIDVAVEGPLGPGGIAHRIARYPITVIDPHGECRSDQLIGPACGTTTTRPGPDHDTDGTDLETVPVTICHVYSATWAQQHQVTRCTHPACWPLTPDEQTSGGTP